MISSYLNWIWFFKFLFFFGWFFYSQILENLPFIRNVHIVCITSMKEWVLLADFRELFSYIKFYIFFYRSKIIFFKSKFYLQMRERERYIFMNFLWSYTLAMTRRMIDGYANHTRYWLDIVIGCFCVDSADSELPVQKLNVFHVNCDSIARLNIGPFESSITIAMHWLFRFKQIF